MYEMKYRKLKVMKEYVLNTPEQYWTVIFGRHVHKSFWGLLLIALGLIVWSKLGLFMGGTGSVLVSLSVAGHIYTDNKPYFKLWDRYDGAKFKLLSVKIK